jgi:hypothetical protein
MSNWLSTTNANRLRQSYLNGFLDISGNLTLRSGSSTIFNDLNVQTYDKNNFDASFANVWNNYLNSTPLTWQNISISATGQYQVAVQRSSANTTGNIWISNNYGIENSWMDTNINTIQASSSKFQNIVISKNGQYITAISNPTLATVGNNIYRSTNFGQTWTTNQTVLLSGEKMVTVALSATGQYQTIITETSNPTGKIWISEDYGANWSITTTTIANGICSLAISANGQYQILSQKGQSAGNSLGNIYYSTTYGTTWIDSNFQISNFPDFDLNQTIAISYDGKYQTVLSLGKSSSSNNLGNIFINDNYGIGSSWKDSGVGAPVNTYLRSVALSGSGKYQIVSTMSDTNTGILLLSKNYGKTWITITPNPIPSSPNFSFVQSLSMSANADYISGIIRVYNGGITAESKIISSSIPSSYKSMFSLNYLGSDNKGGVLSNHPFNISVPNFSNSGIYLGYDVIFDGNYINSLSDNGSKNLLLQSQGGYIGIGNTIPQYPLDISGTCNTTNLNVVENINTKNITINGVQSASSSSGALVVSGGVGISGNTHIGGELKITNTTDSTSKTTGALVVTGGIGTSGNTYLGGGASSSSTTTGALIVSGGVGISGNTFVGGNVGISGASTIGGQLNITNTTASTSTTNGALIVTGGVGISGNTFVGGQLNITNTTDSTSKTTGALIVTGGVGISGNTFVGGGASSSSTDTGAFIVTGGVGISGNTFVGGNVGISGASTIGGQFRITNTTDSTSKTTGAFIVTGGVGISGNTSLGGGASSSSTDSGALIVTGGVGISGNTFVGGQLNITNTIDSTSKTTGALIVSGGVGISGNTSLGGGASSSSTTTGALIVTGGVGISGNTFVGGSVGISGASTIGGQLNITNTTDSTSKTTGAFIVTGGVGISGNTFVGGGASSSSTTSGAFIVTGGVGISGNTFVGGQLNITNTTDSSSKTTGAFIVTGGVGISGNTSLGGGASSSSTTTGALIVTGGVGISGNTFVGGSVGISGASTIGGQLNITNTTDSTSKTTGALIVTGGVGISGNTSLGGGASSSSTDTGALIVTGGVGISGNTFVGGQLNIINTTDSTSKTTGAFIVTGGIGISGNTYLGGGASSSSTTTGALIVTGGVGISGNTFVGGQLNITNTTDSTSKTTGAFIVTGGVGISGASTIGGQLNITNTTDSTSKTTGAFIVTGGVGISGNTYLGGGASSSSTTSGALIVTGGVGISGNTFVGGQLNITNTTDSSSKTTGAFIVTGGVGISGNTSLGGGASSSSTTTGALIVTGGVGISGNTFVGGQLNITNTTDSTSKTTGAFIVTGGIGISGNTSLGGGASSSSTTTGALIVTGGVGISGNTFVGGNVGISGASTIGGQLNITNATASSGIDSGALVVTGGIGVSGNSTIGNLFTNSISSVGQNLSLNGLINITGNITARTVDYTDNSTTVATTQYVTRAINNIGGSGGGGGGGNMFNQFYFANFTSRNIYQETRIISNSNNCNSIAISNLNYVYATVNNTNNNTTYYYKSIDYGNSWLDMIVNGNNRFTNQTGLLTCSQDGKNVFISLYDRIKYSSDYGDTFNDVLLPSTSNTTHNSIPTCSYNGKYVFTVFSPSASTTKIYYAKDFVYNSFYESTLSGDSWPSVLLNQTCDTTGKNVYTVGGTSINNINKIFKSQDYGVNFTTIQSNFSFSISSIKCNSDGTIVYVSCGGTSSTGPIYRSFNGGTTFTIISPQNSNWSQVNCNNNGNMVVASIYGGNIQFSYNYGVNWNTINLTSNWSTIGLSPVGDLIIGGDYFTTQNFKITTFLPTTINTGNMIVSDTTDSISKTTGALVVAGGVGISGNVNIGNSVAIGKSSAPSYTLDVAGDINFTGTFRQNGNPYIGSQWTTTESNIHFNTGNVGIGTTSPNASFKLDVTGNIRCSTGLFVGTDNGDTNVGSVSGAIYFGGTYNDYGYNHSAILSRLYDWTESSELVIFKGNDLHYNVDTNSFKPDRIRLRAGAIAFDTYGSPSLDYAAENIRMYINNSGNVGIGTISPAYKLDVAGDINFTGTFRQNGSAYIGSQWTTTGSNVYFGNSVAIGKSSAPSYTLDVAGDINFTGTFRQNGNPYIGSQWTTTGSNIHFNTGNVGIGTISPSAPLHIIANSNTIPSSNGIFLYNPTITANNHAIISLRTNTATGGNPFVSLECIWSNWIWLVYGC